MQGVCPECMPVAGRLNRLLVDEGPEAEQGLRVYVY